jgi:ABC-type Fe3+/spermidine/putrescine transport system ATPase subunit
VLQVSNLSKRYGTTLAVDDISFEVGEGEVVTLLGPSGCGKSTTLRAVAGLEPVDGGEIQIAGKAVTAPARGVFVAPERRNVGVVFQSYAIWPHMTVGQNVGYPLRLRRLPSEVRARRVAEMLELVGLQEYARRPATQLSGGQQQRVALARALCYEPDILLLDEPLSNLDAKLRPELLDQIRTLQRQRGTSVLFVTHDQMEAMTASHRIAVMQYGRIAQIGSPSDVYEHPTSDFVQHFIGKTVSFPAVWLGDGVCIANQVVPLITESGRDLPPGTAVTVTTRPEDVTLACGDDGACSAFGIVGTLEDTVYLGERLEYRIAIGSSSVAVAADKRHVRRTGDPVRLILDPARVKVWPAC